MADGPQNQSLFLPAFLAFAHLALAASDIRFLAATLSLLLGVAVFGLRPVEGRLPLCFVPASAAIAVFSASR